MTVESTVFIVDDDAAARKSIAVLVETMGMKAETFSSGEEFLRKCDKQLPGCMVTDLRMPGMSGVELQDALVAQKIDMPVIIITAHGDIPVTVRAMKTGAVALLEKPCRDDELWKAIREALGRDGKNRQAQARHEEIEKRLAQLTDNEWTVMDRLIVGKPHKTIAKELDISLRTVESRRSRILQKMRTDTLVELGALLAEVNIKKRA